MSESKGSVAAGMMWMLFLSLLLFWIPTIGPLIAGVVGGKRAGGVGSAIIAALLPSIVLAVGIGVLGATLSTLPVIGVVFGLGTMFLFIIHIGPLMVGAIIGGLFA